MPGERGNQNLLNAAASAFISYAGSSESVTLPPGTKAVSLTATTKCWVKIGQPGETATAAAPSGEKVFVQRCIPINADHNIDVPVPPSTDVALVQVAVIQDSSAGVLDVIARV
jgi:hypothetical protein